MQKAPLQEWLISIEPLSRQEKVGDSDKLPANLLLLKQVLYGLGWNRLPWYERQADFNGQPLPCCGIVQVD